MIIISENEIIHTDSFDDVIEHFGTKGMKWGMRKTKAYAKSFIRNKYNTYRHPILTTKADFKTLLKGKVVNTHRRLDYVNKFVDDRIAAKKNYKSAKRSIDEKYSKLEDKIGTMKGSKDKISRLENRNSEQHMAARKKLKYQYKMNKKNAGGNYKDAGRVI
jgi:hypothetical protein